MATYYLDPVNGVDANAGTSWALAWKTTTNGVGTRVNAGDTIRVAKTADPVNTGLTATWTSGAYRSDHLRTGVGSCSVVSSTNTNPIVVTASYTHALVTGDWVQIRSHTVNTNANGWWQVTYVSPTTFSIPVAGNGVGSATGSIGKLNNQLVTLSSPVTATISNCETVWTNGLSTASLNTVQYKDGVSAALITLSAPAVNSKLAYSTISATNLSSYNQVSFWLFNTVAIVAGSLVLNLCSDTAGATVVNSFAIPAVPSVNFWVAMTFDNAAALGSSIQSVALYSGGTAPGSPAVTLDHIIACGPSGNASSLTLSSLIGKNNGSEGWYLVRSINGTQLDLDCGTNTRPDSSYGYYGTSETVALWRRETWKSPLATTGGSTTSALMGANQILKSGSQGSPITFSAGWNTTTNLQDGDTYWDGQNGTGHGITIPFNTSVSYVNFDRMNFSRYYSAFGGFSPTTSAWINCNFTNITSIYGCGFTTMALTGCVVSALWIMGGNTVGAMIIGSTTTPANFNTMTLGGITTSAGDGLYIAGYNNTVNIKNYIMGCSVNLCTIAGGGNNSVIGVGSSPVTVTDGATKAVSISSTSGNLLRNLNIFNNTADFLFTTNLTNYLVDCNFASPPTVTSSINEMIYIRNQNSTVSAMCISDSMTCQTDLVTVHTAGNRSWNIATSRTNTTYPATLSLGNIVIGNGTNTISAWIRRDNTAMTAGIQVIGGQLEGVANTVQALTSSAANTWAQVSLTISTATQTGPVALQAYGLASTGTQNMWVADISVT